MHQQHNITVDVLSIQQAWEQRLRHVSAQGIFLALREKVVTVIDGLPVIVSTVGEEMLVAHVKCVDDIDTIIGEFKKRGVQSPLDITMSLQLHAPGKVDPFIDKAMQVGLRHVWAASICPIAAMLVRVNAVVGGDRFVTLQRDN